MTTDTSVTPEIPDGAMLAAQEWFKDVQKEFGTFAKERHRQGFEDAKKRLAEIIRRYCDSLLRYQGQGIPVYNCDECRKTWPAVHIADFATPHRAVSQEPQLGDTPIEGALADRRAQAAVALKEIERRESQEQRCPERIYGWISGGGLRVRGFYDGHKGGGGENWYTDEHGDSWSQWDVDFKPDPSCDFSAPTAG